MLSLKNYNGANIGEKAFHICFLGVQMSSGNFGPRQNVEI